MCVQSLTIGQHEYCVCMQGSIHWGGAGGKLPSQNPKLPHQNLVTNHGIQEIFGLNRIKSDLKTSQNQNISWGILPQTPYTMCTSIVSYYIRCTVRRFPPKSTFLDRTLVCMYVCIYVCMYVCMYVHVHTKSTLALCMEEVRDACT